MKKAKEFDENIKKLLDEIKNILDREPAKFRKIVGKKLFIIYVDKPNNEILHDFFTLVDLHVLHRYKLLQLFPITNPAGKILSFWAIFERYEGSDRLVRGKQKKSENGEKPLDTDKETTE